MSNTPFKLKSLALAVSLSLTAGSALAEENQQATDSNNAVDNIVVTATGFEQQSIQAPASISVISRRDLETKQFRDIAEALADVEGVDVRGGTGKTGGLDISIRGMPSEYTLILIDGRRQNVAGDVTPNGFGAALTSFMPPISAIERIEVVRGSMSTLYGSEAMGGIVNIITRKVAAEWGGSVSLEHTLPQDTEWGTSQKTSIYANGPLVEGLLGLAIRGDAYHREASDRILAPGTAATSQSRNPAPAETRQYNLGARLDYTPHADHDIYLDVDRATSWYNNEDGRLGNRDQVILDANAGNLPGYKDYMRINRNRFELGHNATFGEKGGRLESNISYATTETLGRTVPGNVANIGNPYTGFPDIIIGDDRTLETSNTIVDVKYVNQFVANNTSTIGAQYWKAEIEDGMLPSKLKQTMVALFLENEWYIIDSLALTLGGRLDDHDAFGSHFSPRAYLAWSAIDSFTIKGGVNQGFRAPRLNQLADGISGISGQGSTINIGNPELDPETSTNVELGFLFDNGDGISSSITFFQNKIKDRISSGGDCATTWISSCSANPTATYSINIDEAKTWGAEVAAKFDLLTNLSLGLNYTWTDSEVKANGKKNGKLSDTPEHLANISLRWKATDKFSTWLRGEYRGEARRFDGDAKNLTGNNLIAYKTVGDIKAWTQLHLGGSYNITEKLTLNAGINNLLNKDFAKFKTYTDTSSNTAYVGEYFHSSQAVKGGVLPGRTFWVSANYNF